MTTADAASVFSVFRTTATATPDAPFLILPSGRTDGTGTPVLHSYEAVLKYVRARADAYAAAGIGQGDRVALLIGNRPEFFVEFLALNALGAGIVPLNPDLRRDEIQYVLEHSEARLAVAAAALEPQLRDAADGLALQIATSRFGEPAHLPVLGPARTVPSGIGHDTECALLYTSGTTGRPKGCVLSNLYFLEAGGSYTRHGGLAAMEPGRERFYNPLPLFHMNHLAVTATAAMLLGNALVITERFSPSRWWGEIVECGATIVHYLGIVVATLMNAPPGNLDRAHRVKFAFGAGVEPQLHGAFEDRFGFPLLEVWGMTETGRVFIANREPRQIHTRAFGKAFPGFEARVVDEHDRDVPDGTDGELVVRYSAATPRRAFFSGYLKNDAATEEAWRGGWFHSGDVVRRDTDGMLYFVDRKKNIIRRSGENIAAAEVEAVLQAHEKVAQVAVIAVPDELREEEVYACVVPMPGVRADSALLDDLLDWCGERLAYYKAPGWVLFLDTLPTTGTQKVQKTQIFAAGEDARTRPGAFDVRHRKKRG
ncbi:MAG TPA: AMP-binding protein [Hyphomicrobiaceae bacterium]|nr:AMP-binding protein [Hyphomicrobiaceae bacterium]